MIKNKKRRHSNGLLIYFCIAKFQFFIKQIDNKKEFIIMLKKSLLKHFYSIEQNQNYKYPIISTENIYYLDSIPKVILKYGLPFRIKKSNNETCLFYNKFLFGITVSMCFCFHKNKLYSANLLMNESPDNEINNFIYNFEKEINNDLMQISMVYEFDGKKYWELTDGVSHKYLSLNCEKDKIYIDVKFFN